MKSLDLLFGVSANDAARLEEAAVRSVADLAAVQNLEELGTRAGISPSLLLEWQRAAQAEVRAAQFRRRIAAILTALMLVLASWVTYRLAPSKSSATYLRVSALYKERKYAEAGRVLDDAFALRQNTAELHNLRGMIYRRIRKTPDAITEFQKAVELDPSYDEAWNNLGNAHQRKEPERAVQEYQKAVALKPQLALYHRNLGHLWELRGNVAGAEAEYQAAIQAQPSEIESYTDLSVLYQSEKRPDQAETVLVRATTRNPGSDTAFAALAAFYFDSQRYAEGSKAYYRADELDPGAGYLENAAMALREGQQWDQALSAYQKILDKKSDDWEAHFQSGWIFVQKGRPFAQQAIHQLQAAIDSAPGKEDNKWCYLNLALAYSFERKNADADEALTKALQLDPTFSSAYVQRGIFQQDQGQDSEAEKSYNHAIRLDPQDTGAYYNLWLLYRSRNKLEPAAELLRKLRKIAPDDANTQLMLVDSEIEAGRQSHDRRLIKKAIDRLEGEADTRPSAAIYFALAWAYHIVPEVRDLDKAKRLYEESLKYDPGHTQALDNLEVIALAKGDLVGFSALSNQVLKQNPEDLDSLENMGYALFLQGNLRGAVEAYEKALQYEGNEKDPVLRSAYGEALLWRGETTKAHDEFKQARDTLLQKSQVSQTTWVWLISEHGLDEKQRAVYYSTVAEKQALVELFDALTYLRENNVASALEGYQAATKLLSANRSNDKEVVHKAVNDLHRLRKEFPSRPAAELGLGYLYDWLGDHERAALSWKRYLELGTDPVGIEEAHRRLAPSISQLGFQRPRRGVSLLSASFLFQSGDFFRLRQLSR